MSRPQAPGIPMSGRGLGGIGDYLQPLPYRTKDAEGQAGQQGPYGPVSSPITPPPQPTSMEEMTFQMMQLLQRMPAAIAMELCRKFMRPTREAIWFAATLAEQALAAGAAGIVATQAVGERQNGSLELIGLNVNPSAAFNSIQWSVLIDGSPHPRFNQRVFNAGTLATPFEFRLELIQGRTVQLQATNLGAGPISVSGIMIGWTEFLTDVKPYGDSSASGIG